LPDGYVRTIAVKAIIAHTTTKVLLRRTLSNIKVYDFTISEFDKKKMYQERR